MSKIKLNKPAIRRWALLLGMVIGMAALLLIFRPEADAKLMDIPPMRVVLSDIKADDYQAMEHYAGRLRPRSKARLRFEVAGRVYERLTEPGILVERDAPILSLEQSEYRHRLVEAEALLQQEEAGIKRDKGLLALAQNNVALQKAEVQRLETLRKKDLSSRSQLDAARQKLIQIEAEAAQLRYSVDTALARLSSRQAAYQRADDKLQRTVLKAPFDGRINSLNVDVGDYVTTGQVAAEVIDDTQLELLLQIPGHAAAGTSIGQAVQVNLNGEILDGSVISIQMDPDPKTFTHALRVRLPEGLGRSGEVAWVNLVTGEFRQALAVPIPAVLNHEGHRYVFVYRDGHLQRRAVHTLQRVGDWMLLTEGVAAGEQVVAQDVAALSDGLEVRPME